jgi:hypothetical protein
MTNKDDKLPPNVSPPAGRKKPPRRRAVDWGLKPEALPEAETSIGRDDLGNAVWNVHVSSPRRRKDDANADIDPLDVLNLDGLSLIDDEEPGGKHKPFNPYDKSR